MKARSWLLVLLVGTYLLWALLARVSVLSMEYLVLPFAVILLVCQLSRRRIRWNAYAVNLFLMAVFYILAWAHNMSFSYKALYPLILSCVSMTVASIVPAGYPRQTLRHESLTIGLLILAFMVPLAVVGVASVFAGRALPYLWKDSVVGLTYDGQPAARLRLLVHPNTSATLCCTAIMAAIYWLYNCPRRWLRVVLICAMVPLVFAVIHCQSRSDYIALTAGIGALAFRALYLRGFRGKKRIWVAIGAWAVVFFGLLWLFNGMFKLDISIAKAMLRRNDMGRTVSRVLKQGTFNVFSNGRDGIWLNGMRYLLKHPAKLLLGMGSGDIMSAIKAEMPGMLREAGHLHNALLETLARGGLPMLLSALAMLVMLVKPCFSLLVAPETAENRGTHVFVVYIGITVLLSIVEVGLFCYAHLCNILFFYAAGWVMNAHQSTNA